MLAELLLLQQVLDGADNNKSSDTSNVLDKAKSAADDYRSKLTNYLQRFRYRR
jgi:hypothetical protein